MENVLTNEEKELIINSLIHYKQDDEMGMTTIWEEKEISENERELYILGCKSNIDKVDSLIRKLGNV